MEIIWEVEDGYVGKSGPHYLEIDDNELAECEDEEERNACIEACIQDDFDNKVTFSWEKA